MQLVTAMTTDFSVKLNRPYVPENGGGITCELTIEPDDEAHDEPTERHIALCVDSSGSMSFKKMDQVRDATNLVFGLLNDQDYLSIVTFDTEVDVIMEATRWGDIDRSEAEEYLDDIETRGGTDIYAGLEEAKKTLQSLEDGEGIAKRILLLSDGRDIRLEEPDFEPLAKAIADGGASVYSAGIGSNYDKGIIRTVGEQSQGQWAHVESPTDIRSFFGDVVQEASTVVANNPELVLDLAEGCEVGDVYRRLPQVQEVDVEHAAGKAIVGLPDLLDREKQQLVLTMDAPPGELGTTETIADVELQAGSSSATTDISVSYTDDEENLATQNEGVTLTYRETDLRTRIARADEDEELDEVKDLIDETEVITGETEITDALRENVTRIEEGDEEEVREVQENTTVVYDAGRFD